MTELDQEGDIEACRGMMIRVRDRILENHLAPIPADSRGTVLKINAQNVNFLVEHLSGEVIRWSWLDVDVLTDIEVLAAAGYSAEF